MRGRTLLWLALALIASPALGQDQLLHQIDSLIGAASYMNAVSLIEEASKSDYNPHQRGLFANRLSEILILQGKLEQAESALRSIPYGRDPMLEAITRTNLGALYLNKARADLAIDNLQRAYTIFENSGQRNTPESAQCIANLSLVYWSSGKLNQAEAYGLIALQIRQELFGEQSELVAASNNDLGLVYSSTDPGKALSFYEKALGIYEKVHGQEHPKIAIASNNIGAMYRQMEYYDDAITRFEKSFDIWTKLYPQGHPNQASALVNLGRTHAKMHDRKAAIGYFQRALEVYRKSYQGKHPDIASVLNLMGTLQLDNNEFEVALSSFQQAIIANSTTFTSTDVRRNPAAASYYNGKVMLYSLRLKAQALEALHFGKSLKLKDLQGALATLQACDTLIDDIRHHSSDENDKIELGESASEVYEDGVRVSLELSELVISSKPFLRLAFYFAEKSKSAVLQESIADAEAKSFAGLPQELTEQEKSIKSTMTMLVQKLSQKPSLEEEKYLRDALFTTNQEYAALTRRLEHDYPRYFDLKYNQSAPTIESLQALLDPNSAILSFFISEKSKRIYQFIITHKRFIVHDLTLPDLFDKYARGLTNSLLYNDAVTLQKSAQVLSQVLVPSLPKYVTNLIVIPSGRLGTIPFEVLYTHRHPSGNFEEMPFLIHRYAVSYEFSAGLLAQKAKGQGNKEKPAVFLCAPVTFPEVDHLADLPGTEQEVIAIGDLFKDYTQYTARASEATEDFVKSPEISKYNFLHFATHGIVDEASPELSQIYLQPGLQEDGHLFAGEIYNLHLNAELAVLSACQTGLGKYAKGEGVIGLSRALVYAGARNIMVSFWSVSDASTSRLMTDFYQIMLSKEPHSFREVLRMAKIKMISNHQYAAPYYWAPFILIGF